MTNEPPKVTETGLYSASEAIRLLGVSRTKFYNAVKRGARCGGIDGRVRRDVGNRSATSSNLISPAAATKHGPQAAPTYGTFANIQ